MELAFYQAKNTQEPNMSDFPISDGTIEKITCTRTTLLMEFTDWQEKSWEITFDDLIFFEIYKKKSFTLENKINNYLKFFLVLYS